MISFSDIPSDVVRHEILSFLIPMDGKARFNNAKKRMEKLYRPNKIVVYEMGFGEADGDDCAAELVIGRKGKPCYYVYHSLDHNIKMYRIQDYEYIKRENGIVEKVYFDPKIEDENDLDKAESWMWRRRENHEKRAAKNTIRTFNGYIRCGFMKTVLAGR